MFYFETLQNIIQNMKESISVVYYYHYHYYHHVIKCTALTKPKCEFALHPIIDLKTDRPEHINYRFICSKQVKLVKPKKINYMHQA